MHGLHDPCVECSQTLGALKDILDAAPTMTVSDRVWSNLQSETRPRVIRWRRTAASLAAALLLGAIAFAWVVTTPPPPAAVVREAAPGSAYQPGTRVASLETDHYVVLEILKKGLIYVRPGTKLTVDDAENVTLERGEIYCDVEAGPFTIITQSGPVSVKGTRFGVRVADAATTVYTVEGSVGFGAQRTVDAGRLLTVDGRGEAWGDSPYDELTWLRADPALALHASLDGDTLNIEIRNNADAPALIHDIADWSTYLTLRVEPDGAPAYTVNLTDPLTARAYKRLDGRVQIDPKHPMRFAVDLRAVDAGRVTPVFQAVKTVEPAEWTGIIEASTPLRWKGPPE